MVRLLFLLLLFTVITFGEVPVANVKGVGYLEIYRGGKVEVYRILEVLPDRDKYQRYREFWGKGGIQVYITLVEEKNPQKRYRNNTILKADFQNLKLGTVIYTLARLTGKNIIFGKELWKERRESLKEDLEAKAQTSLVLNFSTTASEKVSGKATQSSEEEIYQEEERKTEASQGLRQGVLSRTEEISLPTYLMYEITFQISQPVSAYELFRTILKEYDLIAVKLSRNIIKISLKDRLEFNIGNVPEEVAKDFLKQLERYVSPAAKITYDRNLGKVVVIDLKENVNLLRNMKEDFSRYLTRKLEEEDKEVSEFTAKVYYFSNRRDLTLAREILKKKLGGKISLREDADFNALVVYGKGSALKEADYLISRLSRESSPSFLTSRVFYVRYKSPYDLKKEIEPYLSEEGEVYVLSTGLLQKEEDALKDTVKISGTDNLMEDIQGNISKERESVLSLKNALLIKDYPERIEEIYRRFKKFLSERPIKVRIRARFVEIQKSLLRELGINWNVSFSQASVPSFWQGSASFENVAGKNQGLLTFTLRTGNLNVLDLRLRAYERKNQVRNIAEPHIITLNGEPAVVAAGLEWPITRLTFSQTTTNITWTYKTIPLVLIATPVVLPDGNILLDVSLARKQIIDVLRFPISQDVTQDIPIISSSRIDIKIPVREGETVVIGGIVEKTTSKLDEGIPGLKKIPILGWLFKQEIKELRDKELLIFLTPEVIEE